jgi:Tol biopolymer transport system component
MSIARSTRALTLGLFSALLAGGLPAGVEAQYFGRNNPQYRTFDFQVLRTEHFDIYYYPESEEAIRDVARMAERWYVRLSQVLGHEFTARQPLIFYATHADFQQTNILGSPVGEGTGGVTESAKQRIIMPLANDYQNTDHVLGHELVHAFQYDISGLGRSAGSIDAGGRAIAQAPLWFIEGMAEYLTAGPIDAHTAMWLRDAAITGELPTLVQLERDPRIFPYRYGHALWAYIAGRWGDAVVGQILRQVAQGASYQQALERILNVTATQLSEDWQAAVRRTYLPLVADWPEARDVGTPLIVRDDRGGRINLAPVLSPDGRRVAFLSERGRLAIELWLADAETGQVIRRLVRGTALDTHFSSLNFIASAGSFSPDGRQLAFAALRRGQDRIAIVDVERGGVVREIPVPAVPGISNPEWSPDGRSIVFAGTQGGITNLYQLDLGTSEVRSLTTGRNADMMPSFSPDGRTLAFVTDRGGVTDLAVLRYEGYRIGLLDLATGETRLLPGQGVERNFNPVWSRDGTAVFYISDRDGIANVYRSEVATGAITRVTQIFQGVSGYTDLSPALSSARGTDRLAFSVYERGGYHIYRLDGAERLAGTAVEAPALASPDAAPGPAVLPPSPRPTEPPFQRVAGYLADPLTGLPSAEVAAAFTVEPYRPRLTLDYIGQPQVGVALGGAPGQGGLYGGVFGLWSDMLARHTLFAVLQAQGELDEIGFATTYLYRRQRWDYGVGVQRLPYVAAGYAQTGPNSFQLQRFRSFDTSLQGLAQFPFSRAQRVEFSAGARRIAQSVRVQDVVLGQPQQPETIPLGTYNLGVGSAALVYDNALLGWTSPFAGQRYRFEVTPTVGSLGFVSGLGDFRRYLWLEPFSLALRGMHYGRYAMDSVAAEAFSPVFLGHTSLIRGYEYNRVVDRCRGAAGQAPEECQLLQQLFGHRLALANLELRFPLVRALVLGTGFGVPPIEGFAFYDAGVAWDPGVRPVFARGLQADDERRGLISSAGVGGRINLFGYAVLEIAYARPFVGDQAWHWQFALQPGF